MRRNLLQHVRRMNDGETIKLSEAMMLPPAPPSSLPHCGTRPESRVPLKNIALTNQVDANLEESDSSDEMDVYTKSAQKFEELQNQVGLSFSPSDDHEQFDFELAEDENKHRNKRGKFGKAKGSKNMALTKSIKEDCVIDKGFGVETICIPKKGTSDTTNGIGGKL